VNANIDSAYRDQNCPAKDEPGDPSRVAATQHPTKHDRDGESRCRMSAGKASVAEDFLKWRRKLEIAWALAVDESDKEKPNQSCEGAGCETPEGVWAEIAGNGEDEQRDALDMPQSAVRDQLHDRIEPFPPTGFVQQSEEVSVPFP